MLLFLAIILFLVLIVIHEYGHFLAAKRNGVEVEEFGIGFPPKLIGKELGRGIFRSYYTINALPLGGFVRLKGENDDDDQPGTFGATSFWVKTKIILAGVAMNFVAAVVLFAILAGTGMPQLVENQYKWGKDGSIVRDEVMAALVVEGSPAWEAGIRKGDVLEVIGDVRPNNASELFSITEEKAGQRVPIQYRRDGEAITVEVPFNKEEGDTGYFGVGPADVDVVRYSWSQAPMIGLGTTLQFGQLTYQGLGNMVGDLFRADFEGVSEQVTGPIGLVFVINNIAIFGLQYVLFIVAIISITLAVINSLPIPALDGGRLFVSGLFKLVNRPLYRDLEQRIHGTGFMVLLGLIALISIVDIRRFF